MPQTLWNSFSNPPLLLSGRLPTAFFFFFFLGKGFYPGLRKEALPLFLPPRSPVKEEGTSWEEVGRRGPPISPPFFSELIDKAYYDGRAPLFLPLFPSLKRKVTACVLLLFLPPPPQEGWGLQTPLFLD